MRDSTSTFVPLAAEIAGKRLQLDANTSDLVWRESCMDLNTHSMFVFAWRLDGG